MMKADRMLDSKHSISGNKTRQEFSRPKGYIIIFKLLPVAAELKSQKLSWDVPP